MISFKLFSESNEYQRALAIALGSSDTAIQASKSVYNKSVKGSVKSKNRIASNRHLEAAKDHEIAEKLASTDEEKQRHQTHQAHHRALSQDHFNNSIR